MGTMIWLLEWLALLFIMVLGVVLAVPLAVRQVDGWGNLFAYVEAVNPLTFTWDLPLTNSIS